MSPLPVEQVAKFGPGDNVPVYADPNAIEAGRFCRITGKAANGAYKAQHCVVGERASGVSERKVPAVTASVRPDNRHGVNLNRIGAIAYVEAGAAVAVGALVQSDAVGRAITQTSTNPILGVALTAAAAAGNIIEVDRAICV